MARYKATVDAMVFGSFRRAGDEFTGPEWEDAYPWPMPKHLTQIAPPPAAPVQEKRGRGDKTHKA